MAEFNLKYIVYHWREIGDVENGPMGIERVEDAAFDTEGEAVEWINQQTVSGWYSLMEVTDYPTSDVPPWLSDQAYMDDETTYDCD